MGAYVVKSDLELFMCIAGKVAPRLTLRIQQS